MSVFSVNVNQIILEIPQPSNYQKRFQRIKCLLKVLDTSLDLVNLLKDFLDIEVLLPMVFVPIYFRMIMKSLPENISIHTVSINNSRL